MLKIVRISLLIIFLMLFTRMAQAQAEYTPFDDEVYSFLERLEAMHVTSTSNLFEKPLPRKVIAGKLKEALERKNKLQPIDRQILEKFEREYELEIYGTTSGSMSLLSMNYDPFSQKNKFVYFLSDSGKASVFVNYTLDAYQLFGRKSGQPDWKNSSALQYGGILRGTLLNKFGFYLKATDGFVSGDKELARNIREVRYDYKYNEQMFIHDEGNYFNNTEGYVTADLDLIRFRFGRDIKTAGYGVTKYLLGENTPRFDYLSMNMAYKGFTFSFLHGKLSGSFSSKFDSVQGLINEVTDKYIAYHRAAFDSRHFSFGAGEIIIYSRRNLDLAYLNPFAFYKSLEHSNRDRDNSMLFIDAANNTVPGLKAAVSLLMDDMKTGRIGKGWYGNQTLFSAMLYSTNLHRFAPIDMTIQYVRIEPYVFTHRIMDNSYSHMNIPLSYPLKPNSSNVFLRFIYTPLYNLNAGLDIAYAIHGANELNPDGTLRRNVGGDPLVGHRPQDAETVRFLDGIREYSRSISFYTVYEPWNNYYFSFKAKYDNNSTTDEENGKYFSSTFLINIRI